MKNRTLTYLSVLLVLVLLTMSCNLPLGKSKKPAETQEPNTHVKLNKNLGDLYRSNEGGYSFQVIPDYEIEETWGISYMYPTDADPDAGPMFILIGGMNEVEKTFDDLKNDFADGFDGELKLSKDKKVKIDGKEGVKVEYEAVNNGKEVVGQAIFVAVTPYQVFSLIDLYPPKQYGSKEKKLFDEVSETISFHDPTVADPSLTTAEIISQYAYYAFASSEYDFDRNAAHQATGAPDTLDCGDYETAWSSLEKFSEDWIELGYVESVYPTEVRIFMNHTPNQIVKVELVDLEWNYRTIYSGNPEMTECPYVLAIPVNNADYEAIAVRITVDQSQLNLPWAQIDAVELSGYPGSMSVSFEDPPGTTGGEDPGNQGGSAGQPSSGPGGGIVAPETASGFWDFIRVEDGMADPIVRALAAAPDGSLWIGYGNKGIANLKNGKFTNYTTEQGLTANGVTSLAVDPDGILWIGTTWGISRFDGNKFTNYLTDQGLLSNDVKSLAIDRDGNLWAGVSSGVSRYDGSSWKNYTMDDGLIDKPVVDIAFDYQNGVWFATKSGVSRLKDGVWTSFTEADGLSYKSVNSIAVTFDGTVWFATAGQGVSSYDGNSWQVYRSDQGLTYTPRDMAVADDGALWITSDGTGVFRFNGNSFKNWSTGDGLLSSWIDLITVAPDGSIWVNFKEGGLGRFGN
ncbi:MAG: hypothetical protein K0B14_15215 [Anaerolineaceae bacterium]|nr:hypothetical protein [Anaerolineaceae bacterium]